SGYNSYQTAMQPYQQPLMQQQQNYTQPTIRAEIVQIDGDEPEAQNFPVQTGGTQMMINKSETKIFIKTVYANNQTNLDVYVKQPHSSEQQQPNFDNFVTKEELELRLSQLTTPVSKVTTKREKEKVTNE
ncbi:MAG: hypothetical protein VZR95_10730, partial [Alphaproteobacteria bacterium]